MERHFLSEKKPEMLPFLGRYFRGICGAQGGSCEAIRCLPWAKTNFRLKSYDCRPVRSYWLFRALATLFYVDEALR